MEQIELEIVLALIRRNELHVRGIAKFANLPHANVSRAMKRMIDGNVVDFRMQGKNKLFKLKKGMEALNYAYIAEHFKLLRLFNRYPFISVMAEAIYAKTDAKLIVIFGSYAKFSAKKDSDIDVFIETKHRNLKAQVESIDSRLSIKIGIFDKNNLLIREIVKDHVILRGVEYYYEKNKIFD
ncbi:nucleotidyltransferase domain-containing protein [Candidatus Woesearchaeota archaeon]|nr:nucleotidyltransferase domain-containing protein [Candidatus Woesearchaeota archaeon]